MRPPRSSRAPVLYIARMVYPQPALAEAIRPLLLDRARADIAEAARLSPDDASVALEAGNIAAMMGNDAAARTAWEAAVKIAPEGPQGKAAAKALEQFGTPAPVTLEPADRKSVV